ncbi:MAG TPA: sucrase ferredoxin [Candidatus Nesterenkonia stercoripullorum]|uniref:Sucrase ferredoxin n=1 Tax=Candidatus Nesterenkonia stercoripullorum TaxID=2838701 RepID=A0A9D1UT61_9MICC|nr:sucrase ferredoxin [Candidatus Nesterenkonia stercoripullorum]
MTGTGHHRGPPAASEWAPCSDRSRQRGDPLGGTGGYGAGWFLVEIDSSWGEHAFTESSLDPVLGRAIVRRVERAGLRPVAIRRHGRRADQRRDQESWRWALADSRPGHESLRWGQVDDPAALLEIALDGSAGTASSEPAVLVCTHAKHDRCCAVRGRPVVTALADSHPAATWECSHLGGDRFAATMIVLPHGLYYGRVPAEHAPSIMEAFVSGRVVPDFFRGRSSLSNAVQAAQAFARDTLGDTRIPAWQPVGEQVDDDGSVWRIVLSAPHSLLQVNMHQTWSEPLLSTCAAVKPAPVREFSLDSVELLGSEVHEWDTL